MTSRLNRRRRGVALMIVMIVVAVATVLGFAMVSASSLQAETAGNMKYVSEAEYLADSGGQLALYYLQHTSASPVATPNGYYPGQTGVTFGGAVKGTADITVTYNSTTKLYTITSVGKATLASGSTINKTLTATAAQVTQFKQTAALSATNNLKLAGLLATTYGDVETNGTLTMPLLTTINGAAKYRAPSSILGLITGGSTVLQASDTVTVPALSSIKDYTGTYTYQGQTYTAQKLTNLNLASQTLPTASDALTNPAGIYWIDQNVNVNGGVTFNGTLIITNGTLKLTGLLPNTFTPKPGFPAMVIQSYIDVNGLTVANTINGLVWSGSGLKTGPIASFLTINGAYLSTASPPIDNNYKGTLTFRYDSTKCAIPDFSTTNATAVGVRVVTWTMS